jgi:hypothetical protein
VSTAARYRPDQRSRVTETSVTGPPPTANQRSGRFDPLVYFASFFGGALLLPLFVFVAPAVFLAAAFLAPF